MPPEAAKAAAPPEGAATAGAAGLIWYSHDRPGIRRRRRGRGWSYIAPDGTSVDAAGERARIAALAVPPAYEDVWICPEARGHLQATGRDAARRLQYRYHPDWTTARAEVKFAALPAFGRALPEVRDWIARGLRAEPGSDDFATAMVLRLIDRASTRIGGPGGGGRGATTLRAADVRVRGRRVRLDYRAKGGVRARKSLDDAALARALHRAADLPGATLAVRLGADGAPQPLRSEAVNARLADLAGPGMTAKTFRTWNGTLAALECLLERDASGIGAMADAAGQRLHNTPAVARRSYIHPAVAALAGAPPPRIGAGPRALGASERVLMRVLEGS